MKYFFNKNTLAAAVGILIGLVGYDYFTSGEIDLVQLLATVILTVLLVGLLQIYKSRKA